MDIETQLQLTVKAHPSPTPPELIAERLVDPVDSVNQNVRFTDNHLGRSALIVAARLAWLSLLLDRCWLIDAAALSVCRWRCVAD
ncbi:hypothetical protein M0D69_04435, partial [Caballeronia sp. SEWSISQ10-4 2]|uniref:hypothetical protein n=1 Tax=Caballeronia sp. SEWSISQ10-4 2 TaxID=2937438 RepID=UPI00264F8201